MSSELKQKSKIEDLAAKPEKKLIKKTISYGAAAAIIVTIFAYLFSQFVAAIVLAVGAQIFGSGADQTLKNINDSTGLQFIYFILIETISVYVIWRFIKWRGLSFRDIGMGRKLLPSDLSKAIGIFVVYFVVLLVAMGIISAVTPLDTKQEQEIGFDNAKQTGELLMVFISLAILPPIVEEIMMRGFLYSGLRKNFKVVKSALIVSIMFAALHLQIGSGQPLLWTAAIDTFILSMFLVYLREKTGAIWAGMIVHFIKNSLAFLFLFVLKIPGL